MPTQQTDNNDSDTGKKASGYIKNAYFQNNDSTFHPTKISDFLRGPIKTNTEKYEESTD